MASKQQSITLNNTDIPVLACGKGWIVIDKPCGVSIHNNPGNDLCSVILESLNYNTMFATQTAYDKNFGANPVNRIDSDTSGIVLVGLQKEVTAFFSRQFQERSVEKTYIALVHGCPESKDTELLWNMPLSPKAGGRKNPAGTGAKIECTTAYRIIETSEHYSLIKCTLLTGRKHQIRRHAKLNGTPITGDKKYGSPRSIKYLEENCAFKRLGLHSLALSLTTPDGERLTIESQIPHEFIQLIQSDKSNIIDNRI